MKLISDLPAKTGTLSGTELLEIQDGGGPGSSKHVTTAQLAAIGSTSAPAVTYTPNPATGLVGVTNVQQALDTIAESQVKYNNGALTRKTALILGSAGSFGTISLASTLILLSVSFSAPMRLRFYDTVANAAIDKPRLTTTLPPQGSGLLFEGVGTFILPTWNCNPPATIANGETTTSSNIAYNFDPLTVGGSVGNANLTYLVLQL